MHRLTKVTLVISLIIWTTQSVASSLYPIHQCDHPRFNTDRRGCHEWQIFWDRADTAYWANCPWNPAAKSCWDLAWNIYSCPPTRNGLPITLGDLIRFHDWATKVFRDANADGQWSVHPRASIVWQHLNGLSIDLTELGYFKRREIKASIKALTSEDIIHLARVLFVYSSINDTVDGFNYILARVNGCSNDHHINEILNSIKMEWQKLRDGSLRK